MFVINFRSSDHYRNKPSKMNRSIPYIFLLATLLLTCSNNVKDPNITEALPSELPAERSIEIDTSFTLDYLRGHFQPSKHSDFVKVDPSYTDAYRDYYLHRETWKAYKRMADAAAKDGVKLIIRSATRNFEHQKTIWEGKWNGTRLIEEGANAAEKYPDPKIRALRILLYSSMPGTSRHHWGTDLDLNNFTNEYFQKGEGAKIYQWLVANAPNYGFCQPYSPKGEERPFGYEEERWHWSYLPLAQQLTALAKQKLTDEEINGFEGAETAVQIGVVEKYILGINKDCLH
jgi:D-alanyl-D-alanine carboxypeptidase